MQISAELHAIMLGFVLAMVLGTQLWGKRSREAGRAEQASQKLGTGMIILWLLYNIYYFQPSKFKWEVSLPLHACDVISVISGIVLIKPFRIGRAILYFSAIALTTQALITPTGIQDPATYRFWLYWCLHAGIIACSLFDLTIRGYRPSLKDFFLVIAVDVAYALVVIPIDVIFGWNYGYMGNSRPDGQTVIDLLGPWPQRIPLILGLTAVLQLSMLALWVGNQKLRGAKNGAISS